MIYTDQLCEGVLMVEMKTYYDFSDRLYPYLLTNASSSLGPRDPYGYDTGRGAGPSFPSIQCKMGVNIYNHKTE